MTDTAVLCASAAFAVGCWLLAHGLDSLGEHIADGLKARK